MEEKGNKLRLKFALRFLRGIAIILLVFFVIFVNFSEPPIDKEAFISEAFDNCNNTNLQKVAPEQFLQEDDIKILNEGASELKDADGKIITPLSQHLQKVKSSEVSDCNKIADVCRENIESEECVLLISKFM